MAGSLRPFRYTADDGTTWGLFGDESNIEAINTGVGIVITPAEKYKVPKNLKVRTATYVDNTGRIRRKIPVLTPAIFGALDPTDTITDQVSGEVLRLRFTQGEQVSLLALNDTALNDGDND